MDDDQIYGPRLLEKLLTATGPLPGRAVGAATQHAYHYLQGAVLEGVHGVLFQRKFFDKWASNYEGGWARPASIVSISPRWVFKVNRCPEVRSLLGVKVMVPILKESWRSKFLVLGCLGYVLP